ncbi:MAG TPA: TadE/TadG family type IV pilus assembly protein [Novosphingobium sp.]|nr:TadE/TadG family type IV pilus assembly protein [Novosphingobium sp.]
MTFVRAIRGLRRSLAADTRGTALIELAMVAPVLVLFSIGGFEVSRMVSRQNELQSAVSDVESIVLAANAGASTDTPTVKDILKSTLSLSDDQVEVTKYYRCDTSTTLVTSTDSCGEDAVISSYVKITLRDVYTPIWSRIGVTGDFNYNVSRMIQLS